MLLTHIFRLLKYFQERYFIQNIGHLDILPPAADIGSPKIVIPTSNGPLTIQRQHISRALSVRQKQLLIDCLLRMGYPDDAIIPMLRLLYADAFEE